MLRTEKKDAFFEQYLFSFLTVEKFVFRFVFGKFVKTCRELDCSRVRSEQEENAFLAYKSLPELDQRLYQLHSNLKSIIVFEAPTLHFPENNQILGMYEIWILSHFLGCASDSEAAPEFFSKWIIYV